MASDEDDVEAKQSLVVDDEKEYSLCMAYLKIAVVVLLYWTVSISMVFLNNYLLSESSLNLDVPLFLAWFQCVISYAITIVGSALFSGRSSPGGLLIAPIDFRWARLWKISPLSLAFVAMIAFNNLCLKNVGVAFYFVGRSLSIVFNVILTYYLLGRRTSLKAILCCAAIVIGFVLGEYEQQLCMELA